MAELPDAQISMHAIPVRGGWGAAAIIVALLTILAVQLPMQRALWGMGLGVLGGVALIAWRRRR